jgi:hypothetical protein
MGAAADIEAWLRQPSSVAAYEKQRAEFGDKPSEDTLMKARLIPDPRKVRLRVYQTNSTHKSMSAIRQGSMLLVKDVEFHTVEAQFREAVFTHASTSPNCRRSRGSARRSGALPSRARAASTCGSLRVGLLFDHPGSEPTGQDRRKNRGNH